MGNLMKGDAAATIIAMGADSNIHNMNQVYEQPQPKTDTSNPAKWSMLRFSF
jgi:hypothetical protein